MGNRQRRLGDPERRTAIAKAARRWAVRNLDLGSQVQPYEALYEEILG